MVNLEELDYFYACFAFTSLRRPVLFIFSPFAYAYVSVTQTDKRTDYPGKEIAKKEWKKFRLNGTSSFIHGSLFVKGDEWIAGNLSYHLPSVSYSFKSRPRWKYSSTGNFICGKTISSNEACIKIED